MEETENIHPTEVALTVPEESHLDRMTRIALELLELGVSPKVTHELLLFDLDIVEQQLRWLPARNARRESSLIVAAIKENYEKPATIED